MPAQTRMVHPLAVEVVSTLEHPPVRIAALLFSNAESGDNYFFDGPSGAVKVRAVKRLYLCLRHDIPLAPMLGAARQR